MTCPHCNKRISDKAIAKHLASKGGSAVNDAKAQAARENGKRGGFWKQKRNLGKEKSK